MSYSLVAAALVILLFLLYTPEARLSGLAGIAYLLLGSGIILLAADKVRRIIQQERIRKLRVRCQTCGWDGRGEKVVESLLCPECDSHRLVAIPPDGEM